MATRRILKVIRQAKAGDAAAQLELGRCYLTGGEGLGKNLATAYLWLSAAADKGQPDAAWLIGEQVPPAAVDCIKRAKTYYQAASSQGSVNAAVVIARWSLNGLLGPQSSSDSKAQLSLLRHAAQAGNRHAQITLGSLASGEGQDSNDIRWLICSAERGDRDAIKRVLEHFWRQSGGELWHPGQVPGQPGNKRSAAQLGAARLALYWHEVYWSACPQEIPSAEIRRRASLLLLNGQDSAGKWLQQAAEKGDAIAAYLLALMYMGPEYLNELPHDFAVNTANSPKFPGRNYKQAACWLGKASNGYLAEADFALWLLNGLRNYTCRDPLERCRRLTRAAKMGHGEACWLKGNAALKQGDLIGAAHWFERAAAQGNRKSQTAISELAREIVEPNHKLLDASESLRQHDPALALRLELGAYFDLFEHEFLLLDPQRTATEEFLLVDVRAGYAKARPRLVRVSSIAQRSILHRARLQLRNDIAGNEPYKNLKRRFRQKCVRLGIDPGAFGASRTAQ